MSDQGHSQNLYYVNYDTFKIYMESKDREMKVFRESLVTLEKKYNTLILLMVANLVGLVVALIKGMFISS